MDKYKGTWWLLGRFTYLDGYNIANHCGQTWIQWKSVSQVDIPSTLLRTCWFTLANAVRVVQLCIFWELFWAHTHVWLEWKWWNLPNLIKEEIPIWRGKGDEKRKKPMSYEQTKTQKCKPINEICKRQQLGLAKEVQNNNLKPKTLTNCVKHIWQRDGRNTKENPT